MPMSLINMFPGRNNAKLIEMSASPTTNEQIIMPPQGYDGISKFTLSAIPDTYTRMYHINMMTMGMCQAWSEANAIVYLSAPTATPTISYTDDSGATHTVNATSYNDGIYSFTMPSYDVIIT